MDDNDRGSGARERSPEPHLNLVGAATSVADLKGAVRRARIENAERSDVIAELRGAEAARLEILQEQLAPILAQVPDDCDLFDVALVPSEHPRLFIDMIGFVEMGRDRRLYRFVQDTRHGRIVLCETEQIERIVEAVTKYVAQRLVERERALAADANARALAEWNEVPHAASGQAVPLPARRKGGVFVRLFVLLIDVLGLTVLLALITAAAWYVYKVQVPG